MREERMRRAGALLLVAALWGARPMSVAGASANPFFAMDTAIRDAEHFTRDSQVRMVADLGYDGITLGLGTVDDLSETLRLLDARGLKLYGVYIGLSVDGELPARLAEAMPMLKGRGACIWAPMSSTSSRPSSPVGDVRAVPLLRELADMAAPYGVSVSLYPHAGLWIERIEDALRVADKVDRPNVGVTFNLCHWLKVAPHQDLVSILRRAAPRLTMVSICGADREGMDWRTLIQTLDRGTYDVGRVLEALREVAYAGPIGFQGFGIGGDAHENLARSMAAWQALHQPKSGWQSELLGRELAGQIAAYHAGGSRQVFTILEERLRDAPPDGLEILEDKLLDLLDAATTTLDAKRRLIGLLGRGGTPRSVPKLGRMLDEPATTHAALEALRSLTCSEADRVLRDALGRLKGKSLVGVINVVGERRDAKALAALTELAGSAQPAVARAAIGALGNMGSADAVARLTHLRAPETLARTHALLRCADSLMTDGADREARSVFADVFANGQTIATRVAALNGLARVGGAEAVRTVLSALGSEEDEICRAAAGLLVDLQGPEVARVAAERLSSLPEDAQVILLAGLARRGDRNVAAAVVKAATEGSEAVRLAAIEALGCLGGTEHIPLLCRTMSEPTELGTAARESLCRLDAPGVERAILDRLSGQRAGDRCGLVGVVADRRMTIAVPALIALVRDGDDEERDAALIALRGLAATEHFSDLVALLGTGLAENDRSRLASVLKAVIARDGITDAQLAQLISALRRVDVQAKPAVLEALGRSGADGALAAVRECLESDEAEVRKAAVRALAGWPNAKPLPVLRDVARREADPPTAALAFRGYVDMLTGTIRQGDSDALSALDAAASLARRPEDKQYALAKLKNLQRAMDEIDGCICKWEVAGPYTATGGSLFNTAFPPEQGDTAQVEWRSVDTLAGPFTQFLRPGDVNLGAIIGGSNRVAYLRTDVFSASEREAVLELGSDDGLKAWFNGDLVCAKDAKTAHKRASYRVAVHLKKGSNLLMLKVTQVGGEWGASARLRMAEER